MPSSVQLSFQGKGESLTSSSTSMKSSTKSILGAFWELIQNLPNPSFPHLFQSLFLPSATLMCYPFILYLLTFPPLLSHLSFYLTSRSFLPIAYCLPIFLTFPPRLSPKIPSSFFHFLCTSSNLALDIIRSANSPASNPFFKKMERSLPPTLQNSTTAPPLWF